MKPVFCDLEGHLFSAEVDIADWFNERSSIRFANYAMGEDEVNRPRAVACRGGA